MDFAQPAAEPRLQLRVGATAAASAAPTAAAAAAAAGDADVPGRFGDPGDEQLPGRRRRRRLRRRPSAANAAGNSFELTALTFPGEVNSPGNDLPSSKREQDIRFVFWVSPGLTTALRY